MNNKRINLSFNLDKPNEKFLYESLECYGNKSQLIKHLIYTYFTTTSIPLVKVEDLPRIAEAEEKIDLESIEGAIEF